MAATPHEDPCMDSRTTRLNGNCLGGGGGRRGKKTHFQAQCILTGSFAVFDISKMNP